MIEWSTPLVIAIALGAMLAGAIFGMAFVRRHAQRLIEATKNVARDTSKRIVASDTRKEHELHEIGEWINFLAADAEKGHRALAHERVLLSSVADGLTQGVIALDEHQHIELLNDAARKMLGVASSPLGEALVEFVRVPELRELIAGELGTSAEIQLPMGPRTLVRVVRKFGAKGCVLLLEDVTAMRRLETVRRDFVANVSHELRTPVAVIRANAETLMAGAKDDPAMSAKLVDGLHRNAERLARILADLLDLSRLDAGQYRMELASVPIRGVVEQSLTAVEPQATTRKIAIEVAMPETLAVKADAKALDQILVNLIDNAVKYSRPEGHVWVEARADGDAIRIEVRDDGPGIAAKHRERVFERFYRADPSRSREAGGTGLGLSIVKHLVESMSGDVGVEPNSPTGSIFWLRLPKGGTT